VYVSMDGACVTPHPSKEAGVQTGECAQRDNGACACMANPIENVVLPADGRLFSAEGCGWPACQQALLVPTVPINQLSRTLTGHQVGGA